MVKNKNEGWAAVAVVTIVLLLFTLAMVSVSLGKSQKKASIDYFNYIQAYYKADSAVEKTIVYIKEHPEWVKTLQIDGDGTPTGAALSNGEGPVKIIRKNSSGYDSVLITSTGRHKNGIQMLEVEVLLEQPLDFSKGLWLESTPSGENASACSGDCHIGKIPEFDASFYEKLASRKCTSETDGLCELVLTPDNDIQGITYCEEDLSLHGVYEGQGTIVSTGDICIGGTLEPVDDISVLTLVSPAKVIIDSGQVECLIYAGGDLVMESGSGLIGSVIAGNMNIGAGSYFLFATEWGDVETVTVSPCLKLTGWEEKYGQ